MHCQLGLQAAIITLMHTPRLSLWFESLPVTVLHDVFKKNIESKYICC